MSNGLLIAAISGSLRDGSYNTRLVDIASQVAPPGVTVELVDISELPLYDADVERELGFPEPVAELRERLGAADGILFATPEYNYSVTGALKNAIDWASRRPSPLDRKPAAMMGAGGRSGTARSQSHLRDILRHNEMRVVSEPQVLIERARAAFDDGGLPAEDVEAVRELVKALATLIRTGV